METPSQFVIIEETDDEGRTARARVRNPKWDDRIESHLQKAREDRKIEMAELEAARKTDAAMPKRSWLEWLETAGEGEEFELLPTAMQAHREKYPPIRIKNQPAYGDYDGTGFMDAR